MKLGKARFLLFSLLLGIIAAQQNEVNVMMLFSMTTMQGDARVVDGSVTFASLVGAALINHLNQGGTPVTGREFTCDVKINFDFVDTVSDFSVALQELDERNLENFDIIVGPSRSTTCIPVSFFTSTLKLPVLSPLCTSPDLDDVLAHRFFARTIPSDVAAAKAVVQLLKSLPLNEREPLSLPNSVEKLKEYDEVVVLYQEDSFGSRYKDALFENNGEINFIFIPFQPGNANSIKAAVDAAAATQLNIFIGVLFRENLRALLNEAQEVEIVGPGKLWIFTDALGNSEDTLSSILQDFAIDFDLVESMNNTLMVQASASNSENGILNDFTKQLFTEAAGYNITQLTELLIAAGGPVGDNIPEADFSQVIEDMSSENVAALVNDFSPFTYDAILAVREFVDRNCNNTDFNGPDFIANITAEDFSFLGVTGDVAFDPITGSRTEQSSAMKALNLKFFKVEGEEEIRAEDVLAGLFVFENGIWDFTPDLEFPGSLKTAPLKADPPENVERNEIGNLIKGTVFTLAIICALCVVMLMVFIYFTSHKQVIEAAQPMFLMIMLFGVLISTSAIVALPPDPLSSGDKGDWVANLKCNASYYLISLGLTVSYGSLVFKLKRVLTVANASPDLTAKHTLTRMASLRPFFFVILVNLGIMGITFLVNPLELRQRVVAADQFGQPLETFDVCLGEKSVATSVYLLFFIFHGAFYIYGFYLINKARQFTGDFQEGRWIFLSVVSQFQLYLLGVPVYVAIGVENPDIRFLVASLLVLFSNFILMGLIFGPKISRVMSGDDNVLLYRESTKNVRRLKNSNVDTRMSSGYGGRGEVGRSLTHTMATDEFGVTESNEQEEPADGRRMVSDTTLNTNEL